MGSNPTAESYTHNLPFELITLLANYHEIPTLVQAKAERFSNEF